MSEQKKKSPARLSDREKSLSRESLNRYQGKSQNGSHSNGHCSASPSGGHWWVIGGQFGVWSTGTCKFCRKVKRFANSMDYGLARGSKRKGVKK